MGSVFELEQFKPYEEAYQARVAQLSRFWKYYKSDYNLKLDKPFDSEQGQYTGTMIRNAIKPIFTPLGRAVNLDVALIPGMWKLDENGQAYKEQVDALFEASDWPVEGDLFVKFFAAMGEAGLRIVDDRVNNRVYMAPVRPETYIKAGPNKKPHWALFIEMRKNSEGEDVEYATFFSAEEVQHYVDGVLAAHSEDRPAQYPNALGRVPLVVAFNDSGDGSPEPTFDDTLTALNQVNQQASHMAAIIIKHVEPQWAAVGAEATDLEKSGDNVWFFPEGSDIKAILAAVDFDGLLKFVQEIKEEMKESLPELALRELVGTQRVAAATIELQLAEAVFKIKRLRKPVDSAVSEAVTVCLMAMGEMNGSQTDGTAEMKIKLDANRPVITVDALTRLQIESQQASTEMAKLALEREQSLGIQEGAMDGDNA